MKNRIAEDLRMAGKAKFYHAINIESVEDIKRDIIELVENHGKKYELSEYIDLFDNADYWLYNSIILGDLATFIAALDGIERFDHKQFITTQYEGITK